MGDASRVDAEEGEPTFDRLLDELAALLRAVHDTN
jgi:creatinine amidohydrolase/Fe(II)-dependent formamide hydrolase-like protein